ncbi:MAG: GNAT family protein [Alphaproteobacteria bacterium]|nr:GNAT family protein [Alphaproteobacteria bacterium]
MTQDNSSANDKPVSETVWKCPVIITDRLYIRPARYCDAEALTDILKDPDVSGKIAIFRQPYQHEDSINLCRLSEENADGSKGWFMSIFLRGIERQIGYILLPMDASGDAGFLMEPCSSSGEDCKFQPKSAEVGYWLGKDHWGQGYASEALKALLSTAFDTLPLDYIHASTATYNEPSKMVLSRHGFVQEPQVFMRQTVTGEDRPSNNFKITAEQWRKRNVPCAQRPAAYRQTAYAGVLRHEAT